MSTNVPTTAIPAGLTPKQLDDIQGDIWSKGFPKNYETYYFFSIVPEKREAFAPCLKLLAESNPSLISTLNHVSHSRKHIDQNKSAAASAKSDSSVAGQVTDSLLPVSNALIAFTFTGLKTLQKNISARNDPLGLSSVRLTDPAFSFGMSGDEKRKDDKKLNDPELNDWDDLFKLPEKIHGLLKIAGSDKDQVDQRLQKIKDILRHKEGVIIDVPGSSPPTMTGSRVDGWTRPKPYRGREHFGFEDGISQPLMKGLDGIDLNTNDETKTIMNTLPHLLIVSPHTYVEGSGTRPEWMTNGSFLVLRKLQQDVEGFEKLVNEWDQKDCASKEQMEAKLMGRYRNGDPIAVPGSVARTTYVMIRHRGPGPFIRH